MLGYVKCLKSELKVRDAELYGAYYCGVCKSIGKRLGQAPRFTLSYDAAFLALLLASLKEDKEVIEKQHCIAHHINKKPIVLDNNSIDYAADVMVILAYHKFIDDINDDNSFRGHFGKVALYKSYHKLRKKYGRLCEDIEKQLTILTNLEKEKCGSLDRVLEAFALIMESLFTNGPTGDNSKRQLSVLGKNLGRWIYLIDAADDLARDIDSNSYNPILYRYSYDAGKKNKEVFWDTVKPGLEYNLYQHLAEISSSFDLLDIKKNKEIIENVIFLGLRKTTDMILEKGMTKDEKPL